MDIFADLAAEQDRLDAILGTLDDGQWAAASGADGWSVADVVLHLAQTNESVEIATGDGDVARRFHRTGQTLDETMAARVEDERAPAREVYARWQRSCRASLDALRAADPQTPLPWAAAALKPATLATTRIAEHWAHGLDITEPLGIPFPDTDRLRHVAWLGHGSLPYAAQLAGVAFHPVRCELVGPGGDVWALGPPEADSAITGSAGAFCRVGAQRLAPDDSGLRTTGPHGAAMLAVLRNYAA